MRSERFYMVVTMLVSWCVLVIVMGFLNQWGLESKNRMQAQRMAEQVYVACMERESITSLCEEKFRETKDLFERVAASP